MAGQDWLAERLHASPLPRPAGTSSILAGAALAAVQRAAGRAVGAEALIHAVLHLEQVLTTGRGLPRGRTGIIRNRGSPGPGGCPQLRWAAQ